MPRRLTALEITRRIGMRTALDSGYATTQTSVAKLFHASLRTVNDAARRTVSEWLAMLRILPAPRPLWVKKARPRPSPVPSRPGDRSKARLNEPEPTIDIPDPKNFDMSDPVVDDDAIEHARDEAIDDYEDQVRMTPEAYAKKQREKR